MNHVRNYKVMMLSTASTPISHMMGVEGNEAVISRESVLHKGSVCKVPVISGNAIRHRMVRDPGALYLVDVMGMRGKLSIDQANYMFNGGSLTESSTNENLSKIAAMQNLFPLLRLLGGSLRNQVIGGSLNVYRGILACEENREVLEAMLGKEIVPSQRLRPAEDFVSGQMYTRCDASKRPDSADLMANGQNDEKNRMMPYSGQSVIPGSMFIHGFHMQNVSHLEVGALYHALQMWESNGSSIGGMGRIGHGVLSSVALHVKGENFFGDDIDPAECVLAYIAHCEANKDKMRQWMMDTFPERPAREEKLKPIKKASTESAQEAFL